MSFVPIEETKQSNDNLSNDKVDVDIKPETDNNKTNINVCAFNFICNCFKPK
jgi:hypothetical protein